MTSVATYSYNAANQLTRVKFVGVGMTSRSGWEQPQGETFQYDGNGNLVSTSGGARYEYNAAGQTTLIQPSSVSLDPDAHPGVPLQFSYAGTGQTSRLSAGAATATVPGAACAVACPTGPTASTTEFTNTLLGVASESVAGPTPLGATTTFYMLDLDGTALASRGTASTTYYVHDGLGSVAGVTDDEGELVSEFAYDPFGDALEPIGQTIDAPWRFAGGYLDKTGLFKFGERYYDPSIGRWTQQDPVYDPLDPKQWNRYLYVGNDPVNFIDPSGRDWYDPSSWDWGRIGRCAVAVGEAAIESAATVFGLNEIWQGWQGRAWVETIRGKATRLVSGKVRAFIGVVTTIWALKEAYGTGRDREAFC